MTSPQTLVPEIRFEGFSSAWEQRKLADVLSSYTDPVEIPHTGYERLGIRSHAKGTFHSYVPAGHELQTAQMHKVAADKFIVNITFGWEHAVAVTDENDAGKLVSHRFPQFSLSEELDPKFLKFIILDENFRHHLWLASPGGAGRNRVLNLTEMLQYEIYIPSVSEQRQIADVLIRLDNLITLHQRRYDQLKNVKKSMLEKMFPRNGANVPEIRFAGFTNAWEQRKLGDEAIEMVAGGDIDKSLLDEYGRYPVIANALTDDGIVGYYAKEYRIKAPAVTVTGRGDVGHAKARTVDFTPVVRLLSVRSRHDVFFLENAINTLNIIIESTGVPQLTVPQLSHYEIFFPPTVDEEIAIGAFFGRIDNLIALHQCKCDKLKEIKNSLLQKMFV